MRCRDTNRCIECAPFNTDAPVFSNFVSVLVVLSKSRKTGMKRFMFAFGLGKKLMPRFQFFELVVALATLMKTAAFKLCGAFFDLNLGEIKQLLVYAHARTKIVAHHIF